LIQSKSQKSFIAENSFISEEHIDDISYLEYNQNKPAPDGNLKSNPVLTIDRFYSHS